MKRVFLAFTSLFCLFCLFFSTLTWANFTSNNCTNGTTQSTTDFGVVFKVGGNNPKESIIASKPNGQDLSEVLWSNDPGIGTILLDSLTFDMPEQEPENIYNVWVTYEANHPSQGNKTGTLKYYLEEAGAWGEAKDSKFADLKGLNDVHLNISGDGVDDIKCSGDLTPPDISPPPPVFYQDARFKFGQVSAGECYNGCTINFDDIEFRTTPIVFLMSSISPDKLSDDNPSAAFVQSVGTDSATIVQKMPPGFDKNKVGMEPIFYLVAEPGYVQFDPSNNQKALVNTIDTQLYQKAGGDDTGWENVVFDSSFRNDEIPIVLTQVQKLTQDDLWATSAIQTNSVSSSGFKAALELGRRNVFPSAPQTIGYIAALPQTGTTKNNEAFVFSAPSGTFRQPNSLSNSCNTNYLPLGDDFSSYGVILSKQSRTGGDGGWLRLCDLTKDDQFSFIFEEDNTDRKHGRPESVGFFAFEEPEPPVINLCKTFPNVVQSWSSTSSFNITNGGSKVYGTKGKLGGIGFNSVADKGQWQMACDGNRCASNSLLLISEPNVLPFSSGPYLPFDPNNANLPPGKYDEIHLTGGDAVYELTGSYYEIRSLSLTGSAKFLVKPNTFIKVNSFDVSSGDGGIFDISGGSARGLVLWGEYESNIAPDIEISIQTLHADIFSRGSVTLTGGAILKGSITAEYVDMGGDELRRVVDNCDTDNPIVTRIEIKPFNHHLICDDSPQNEVQVHIFDEENKLIGGYQPTLVSDKSNLNITFLSESGGIAKYRVDNAVDEIGNFTLDASLVVDSVPINAEQKTISYVPYKFDIKPSDASSWEQQPISMTAGAGSKIDVRVLGCSGGSSAIVSNYSARLDNDNVEIKTAPVGGDGALSVADMGFSGGSVSNVVVSFDNSGELTATIFDRGFDCSTQTDVDCPTYNGYLQGDFIIQARPWKIAVCDVLGENGETLSNPISGFISSANPFDVTYKPIIYSTGSQECSYPLATNYAEDSGPFSVVKDLIYPDPKTTSAILGTITPVTNEPTNFSPGSATLTVKYIWDEVGSLEFTTPPVTYLLSALEGEGSAVIGRFYPKYFLQDDPEWNVTDQNNIAYLDQPYDSSVHQVYPMASGEDDTDKALNNYRFFASGLQASFGVLDDTSVDNGFLLDTGAGTWSADRKHWLLNDSAAVLQRVTDSDDVSRRDLPFNTSDANSTVTYFGLTVTGVDPVSFTDSDPATDSAVFPIQPPARYGRMALDDIGGNSNNTLTIPLKAEFWNGSEFVLNTDDSYEDENNKRSSSFNGANYCKQVIWHSEGKTITSAMLSGDGNVKNGEEEVTASQNTPSGEDVVREQVRLWLRMGVSKPIKRFEENEISCSPAHEQQPWLQYNWRGKTCGVDRDEQCGDEDPSTVVTFGIYRGNDRVIYRGESGLTGQ